jgi:eukaryotic-like serine/threonine-protein kinase
VLGSPNFMPPEQAGAERGKVGRPSDVYALGGILYHLLTARAPFQADSLEHLITQVLHAEPVSPRLLNPSVPRDLETITLKCLEKEPSRRYQTARELADELGRALLRHEPIHARPITAPEKLWRWCRRKPVLALLIVLCTWSGLRGWRASSGNGAGPSTMPPLSGWNASQARQLYVATMNLVQAAWEQNHVSRCGSCWKKRHVPNAGSSGTTGSGKCISGADGASRTHRAGSGRGLFSGRAADCHRECRATPPRFGKGHGSRIGSVAYSPDGQRIITGGGAVRFSPHGEEVDFTVGDDNAAKVWDAGSGGDVLTLEGHSGAVSSVDFSADGQWVVSGSFDGTARVWDVRTGQVISTARGHGAPIRAVAFLPDGKRFVTGSFDGTATVREAASGKELLSLGGHADRHTDRIYSVAVSSDGHWIATGSWDSTVRLWEAASGRYVSTFRGQSEAVYAVAFSRDSRRIVIGSRDGVANIWNAESQLTMVHLKQEGPIWSAAFSHDGRRIVTGSHGLSATVWDATTGEKQMPLNGHTAHIHAAVFSPDNSRILTGSADYTAKLWDSTSGKELLTFRGHKDWVFSAAFSPDGQRIVTGSGDGTVKVWEAATRDQVEKWHEEERTAAAVESAPGKPR